jgi:hypothetical protein
MSKIGSLGSSVGIVVRFPTGRRNFSLFHNFQIGNGAHPASYTMGIGGFFLGGKAAWA